MSSKEEIQNIFGKVVLELRTEREMTQEQLAEHLGVSPHTITRIETGKTFVSSEVFPKTDWLRELFNFLTVMNK